MVKKISKIIESMRQEGLIEGYYEDLESSERGDKLFLVPMENGIKKYRYDKIPGKLIFVDLENYTGASVYINSDMNGVEIYEVNLDNIPKLRELQNEAKLVIDKIKEYRDFANEVLNKKSFLKNLFRNDEISVLDKETRTNFTIDFDGEEYDFMINNISFWFVGTKTNLPIAMDESIQHIESFNRSIDIIIEIIERLYK